MGLLNTVSKIISGLSGVEDYKAANKLLQTTAGYPSLTALLPYRYYDDETKMFINANSVGYILELAPLSGANQDIMASLDEAFRKRLERNVPVTFYMMASKCVSNILDANMNSKMWQGELAPGLNKITKAYYERAALKGFETTEEVDYPLYLRNYRVFAVVGKRRMRRDKGSLNILAASRESFVSALRGAKIGSRVVNVTEFLSAFRETANYRPGQVVPSDGDYDDFENISRQLLETTNEIEVHEDYLRQHMRMRDHDKIVDVPGEDKEKGIVTSRIVNLNINKNPKAFALWQSADNLHNLVNPAFGISCPFIITFTIEIEDQVKTQNEAFRKETDLAKKANSAYAKLIPSTVRAYNEWRGIREELSKNEGSLCKYYFNVTLFTPDDDIALQTCEQEAITLYRKNGIQIQSAKYHQMRNYLTTLPFMIQEDLWDDLKKTGAALRSTAFSALNLLPVVSESTLSGSGSPLPSYRGQAAFLDIFDDNSEASNFNVAVTGTSGAGKSFMIQEMLRQVLNSGGFGVVIDIGESYKNYCLQAGGVYLQGDTLRFNPWADVENIKDESESIGRLMAVLASPSGEIDDVSQEILNKAVVYSWEKGNGKGKVDYVVEYLSNTDVLEKYKDKPTILSRMAELCELLDRYCTWGSDGEFFNSDNPTLSHDTKFAVLELGTLESRPKLMSAVLFSIILAVQHKMYRTSRNFKKICIIDEAWKLLAGDNKAASKFIEQGYRTVRRHNGCFVTITQGISDFVGVKDKAPSPAASAAWMNSGTKITLLQSKETFIEFLKDNPDFYTEQEKSVIEGFRKAKLRGFSSVLIQSGGHSSFHRLFVDPVTRAMFSSAAKDFAFMSEKQEAGASSEEAALMLAEKIFGRELKELERWANINN
ncbi:type IV secretion system protein TraC [Erwinia amylovora]|uniref:type IV secretion system protein TraC n=1 Tax=Erwinia amylovora TaxID=552 RepID=UPI0020BE9D17|nr:type IV secretion system protein TraC [Erwinia amylovora]MCK8417596.1 type IV secretion system protein TraC [Erwinia amylovora]